ncbi:MAG: hypothetical protein ACOCSE_06435, partial [Chitinivibrionales bacterium]
VNTMQGKIRKRQNQIELGAQGALYTSSSLLSVILIKRLLLVIIPVFLILSTLSCTSTLPVRTVGKGNSALEVTGGGPLFSDLGAVIPMPNLLIGYRYGMAKEVDISTHYNLTTAFIQDIALHLNTSLHYIPIQPGISRQESTPYKGHSLGIAFHIQWLSDFRTDLMILPALEASYGYRFDWFTPFVSFAAGFNIYRPDESYNSVNLYPSLGFECTIKKRTSLSLELTVIQAANNLHGTQVGWVSLINNQEEKKRYGQIGISIGFSRCFGSIYSDKSSGKDE